MCAIHGIVDVKPELMMKMVKAAHHRGPDGNGIFEDDYITLGHNLLSIVGQVEEGKQPYHYEDCVLVYNGEIYNYLEIKKELIESWLFCYNMSHNRHSN